MNTEIDRVLRRACAEDFDGVFSADGLPKSRIYWSSTPIQLANPAAIGCA